MLEFITIKEVKNTIGQWCRSLRRSEKLTQQQLAEELGLSRYTITNLENGENATLETLLKVLQYFDQMKLFNQFITSKMENLKDNKSLY